jgi:hypothetical protein
LNDDLDIGLHIILQQVPIDTLNHIKMQRRYNILYDAKEMQSADRIASLGSREDGLGTVAALNDVSRA